MAPIILILLLLVVVTFYNKITAANNTAQTRNPKKKASEKKWIDSIFKDVEQEINLYQLASKVYRSLGPNSTVERDAHEFWSDMLDACGLPNNSSPPDLLDEENLRRIEIALDACISRNEGSDESWNESLRYRHDLLLHRIRQTSSELENHRRQALIGLKRLRSALAADSQPSSTWQGDGEGITRCPVLLIRSDEKVGLIQLLEENGINCLYHFTDQSNFESIIRSGGLYSWSYCAANNIGISRPGGSALSRELDTRRGLEDYVRMSFVKDHPMMHAAKRDGRLANPITLEIDLKVFLIQSMLFSNRNATATEAQIGAQLSDLKKIRFDLIRSGHWANNDEMGLVQAEVLAFQAVPGYLIRRSGRPLRNPTKDESASFLGLA